MRAVGEVMSIGKTYKEAFHKAIRSLENSRHGLGFAKDFNEKTLDELIDFLEETEARDTFRLYYILQTVFALKRILDATTELNRNWIEARQLL